MPLVLKGYLEIVKSKVFLATNLYAYSSMVKFKGKISHCYHILVGINKIIFKELNVFWDCKFISNEKIDALVYM